MKLYKQSSRRDEELPDAHPYSPKSLKHHTRSLPRSINYLLKEQRLLFILIGILIGSTFFIIQPTLSHLSTSSEPHSSIPRSYNSLSHESLSTLSSYNHKDFNFRTNGVGHSGRVPVGVGRKRMRIVVTGGAGFVGSHLVDKLIKRGDDVIVIDNFFTGRKENVMHHFGNPRFELIRHDVVEPILLEVDQIYHLACPASPVHYKYNPVKTIISFCIYIIYTNVMGTLNMLGLAKRIGARFLLTSTSEVYGDPLEHPQKETYWGHVNPIGVRSCYDEGKRTAETLTMDYHRGAGVEGFNVAKGQNEAVEVTHLQYADDTLIFGDAEESQLKIMEVWYQKSEKAKQKYSNEMALETVQGKTNFMGTVITTKYENDGFWKTKEVNTTYGTSLWRSIRNLWHGFSGRIDFNCKGLQEGEDTLRWNCHSRGIFTVSSAYKDMNQMGSQVRIARIFNTYGPRMCLDDGRVVSNFVAQAIRKQPMTVYGDGKQTRSFQYVSDLVDGLVALMEGEHIGPFNLGNPGEFTMLELAGVVKEVIDPSANIEFRANTADDPHKRKPNISKAKELLNWEPKVSLREGLPLMVSDFRNRILNEDEGKGN
ncbi:UDP-glucuronic acid decarboxylase 1 [Capsicum annuum]|nr:UDP-glucuronic acid decarboxylase 1 [Capsicum annuum]